MTEDAVQLRRFVEKGDEDAFRDLVARHFDLVYGTALRQTNGDASLAQDVAQTVFIGLARKAKWLPANVVLAGWLYKAARLAAANAVRTEQRRRIREQKALAMQQLESDSSSDWERLRPVLDAAVGRLNDSDRNALLLHYFEGRGFRDVGFALGISDDAAQKRVSRALGKLRTTLMRGGLTMSGSSLSILLNSGVHHAVPGGLALSVAKASLARAVAAGPAGVTTLLSEASKSITAKIVVGSALALVILFCSTAHLLHAARPVGQRQFTPLDLSSFYDGNLWVSWTPVYGSNNLASLGEGSRVLNGVPFDIHGVVQLQSQEWKGRGYKFPERIEGIKVGGLCRRLHLLHADSASADPQGTTVASLVLHYADGGLAQFDICYGLHLLDWWEWPDAPIKKPADTNTTVAWRGNNPPAEHHGAKIRLFETAFINPSPEREIQSIDYVSAMANSAPFMVALTVER